jgi:hypothetical protein
MARILPKKSFLAKLQKSPDFTGALHYDKAFFG